MNPLDILAFIWGWKKGAEWAEEHERVNQMYHDNWARNHERLEQEKRDAAEARKVSKGVNQLLGGSSRASSQARPQGGDDDDRGLF